MSGINGTTGALIGSKKPLQNNELTYVIRAGADTLKPLELWGGIESTVNRVGDAYSDQLHKTGHHARGDDLDLIAACGLSTVRYPILWERVCPGRPGEFDWEWSDTRMGRLRELGIRPIVGLVHHGSGPRHTSLIAADFAEGLAAFAGAVAQRYPWVQDWTPINEPLTTARFSALYGFWYPHLRDEGAFWLALLNQIDGVRSAMSAIREQVPSASLVQTEDLGRTYSTLTMSDQAAFDNVRRWMTWDLLFGRVVPGHELWRRLCSFGLEDRLRAIADDPSPPDIVGVNHYLTSDRFLDHRVARYPEPSRGSNGRTAYADVEAIRVLEPAPQGLRGAILEAWERYRTPVAVTELHNGSSREEQVRWLRDGWQAAQDARAAGGEVVAITSWALFGSYDWDRLLTGPGRYEPGAWDIRSGIPRPTAIARTLASGLDDLSEIPAAAGPGWWRRPSRHRHDVMHRPASIADWPREYHPGQVKPLLIVGATGTLGKAIAAECRHRGIAHILTARAELDLLDPLSIERALARIDPWAVINCGGWVRVDDAERARSECFAVNTTGAAALASACAARDIPSVAISSDLVFDGRKAADYTERDAPAPLNVYGASKAQMESLILALPGSHLVVRTAAFFSPFDDANFAVYVTNALARGEPVVARHDCLVSPTYVPDLCNALLDLVIDGEQGIWHLANRETLSWAAFASRLAEAMGYEQPTIVAADSTDAARAAQPRFSGLTSERGDMLPSLQSGIDRFVAERTRALAGH